MKRILCSILVALLVLAIVPLASFATENLPADVNAAINAEGSDIVFGTYSEVDRWTATQTETERYASVVSPLDNFDDEYPTIYTNIYLEAGEALYIEVTPYMSNGKSDIYMYERSNTVMYMEDVEDGITRAIGFVAEEANEYSFDIEFDFDYFDYDEPMYLRVGNAKVIAADELPTYELTYVDYRTLETIFVETVEFCEDAKGLESEQIPVHEGYVFAGYDDRKDMRKVTEDRTIYLKYVLEGGEDTTFDAQGAPVDISALPLTEGVTITNGADYPWQAFSGPKGVFIRSSNQGEDETYSEFTLTLPEMTGNKLLSFEYYVSSEEEYDYLSWGVDQEYYDSGEAERWNKATIFIEETMGCESLSFAYIKDGSVSEGNDSAYIRNIELIDTYNVDYTYIDKYTDEVIVSGEVEYGGEPLQPTYPVHEGMSVYGTHLIYETDGSLTYEVYYREDYSHAGNEKGGILDIGVEPFEKADLSQVAEPPYSIVTEGDREYLSCSQKVHGEDYPSIISFHYDKAAESFDNPVVAFDYRARVSGQIEFGVYNALMYLTTPCSNEWKTAYYPLDGVGEGLLFMINPNHINNAEVGEVAFDIDNIRIIEGGTVTINYHLQVGEEDFTEQRVVPKYSLFEYYTHPFLPNLIPSEYFFYGYEESINFVTENIDVHVRYLPRDRSTVFADPSQTNIALSEVITGEGIQLTPMTIDQREALGAVANVRNNFSNYLFGGMTLTVVNCPKEYLAIDFKIGELDRVAISKNNLSEVDLSGIREKKSETRAAPLQPRELSDTGGEWATVYIPVETGTRFSIQFRRSIDYRDNEEPIEICIDNIRFVDSVEKSTVTIKDVDTQDTLGSFEVENGTLLSELYRLGAIFREIKLPEGKAIVRPTFIEPDSQIIDEDVTLYIELEDKINLDYALNAEGRSIEFDIFYPYQWREQEMDGRTVAVPNEYYSREYSGEIGLMLNVNPGDIITFDYKFYDPNDNTTFYGCTENGIYYEQFYFKKTGEWETITYVCEESSLSLYFYTISKSSDIGEVAYDPEMVLALDNFRVLPGSCDATVRGNYGVTLGDLKDQLPEGWSWVDESIVPDVVNEGYEVTFEAPEDEKIYSSNPNPVKVEVIILPIDLEGEPFTLTGLTTDGTLGSIELPAWLEWKNPDMILSSFNVATEFEAIVQREGVDPRNFSGTGETITVKLTAYDMGDCDLNGEVTAADASEILRHIVKLTTLDEFQQDAANVNRSEDVEAADAAAILRYIVRLQNTLHVTRN